MLGTISFLCGWDGMRSIMAGGWYGLAGGDGYRGWREGGGWAGKWWEGGRDARALPIAHENWPYKLIHVPFKRENWGSCMWFWKSWRTMCCEDGEKVVMQKPKKYVKIVKNYKFNFFLFFLFARLLLIATLLLLASFYFLLHNRCLVTPLHWHVGWYRRIVIFVRPRCNR